MSRWGGGVSASAKILHAWGIARVKVQESQRKGRPTGEAAVNYNLTKTAEGG